jgi:hypothetical protein
MTKLPSKEYKDLLVSAACQLFAGALQKMQRQNDAVHYCVQTAIDIIAEVEKRLDK